MIIVAFQWVSCTVYKTYKPLFSTKFSLKMDFTALFTYLKMILLRCFQFLIFSKINDIQTHPYCHKHMHFARQGRINLRMHQKMEISKCIEGQEVPFEFNSQIYLCTSGIFGTHLVLALTI